MAKSRLTALVAIAALAFGGTALAKGPGGGGAPAGGAGGGSEMMMKKQGASAPAPKGTAEQTRAKE